MFCLHVILVTLISFGRYTGLFSLILSRIFDWSLRLKIDHVLHYNSSVITDSCRQVSCVFARQRRHFFKNNICKEFLFLDQCVIYATDIIQATWRHLHLKRQMLFPSPKSASKRHSFLNRHYCYFCSLKLYFFVFLSSTWVLVSLSATPTSCHQPSATVVARSASRPMVEVSFLPVRFE